MPDSVPAPVPVAAPAPFRWQIASAVSASPQEAWRWITSVQGIGAELAPYLRMSVPPGIASLDDMAVVPGQRLFRSTLYLFGVLAVDHSDLTLLSLEPGVGFVEQSPMRSMPQWRHARSITPSATGCTITDSLQFDPRWAPAFSSWCVRRLFAHRHAVLRARLGPSTG